MTLPHQQAPVRALLDKSVSLIGSHIGHVRSVLPAAASDCFQQSGVSDSVTDAVSDGISGDVITSQKKSDYQDESDSQLKDGLPLQCDFKVSQVHSFIPVVSGASDSAVIYAGSHVENSKGLRVPPPPADGHGACTPWNVNKKLVTPWA